MALDALLAKLEGKAVTSVTSTGKVGVTAKSAPTLACTPVTAVTSRSDDGETPAKPSTNDMALFDFSPPIDPASDAEALAERIAIKVEAGIPEVEAAQEARWQADRERCLRRSIQHAALILSASGASRVALLYEYQRCLTEVFGTTTADRMTATMREWVAMPKDPTCH